MFNWKCLIGLHDYEMIAGMESFEACKRCKRIRRSKK